MKETQTETVKPSASVRRAIVCALHHEAVDHHDGEGMLAASSIKRRGHNCVRSRESAARGARDDLVEHLKKRISGRGKERDWAGT
jgi:hypothetical protein